MEDRSRELDLSMGSDHHWIRENLDILLSERRRGFTKSQKQEDHPSSGRTRGHRSTFC
jgi:hypothetical protein